MTMTSKAGEWLDAARGVALLDVAAALGLAVHPDGKSFGPCPGCGEATRGKRGDKRGRCVVLDKTDCWACHSNGGGTCGAGGDGLALVAWTLTGKAWAKGDRETSGKVREWYAALGWCEAWNPSGKPTTPATLRPRIAPVARVVPAPPQRPDPEQVRALWRRCVPVTADPEVAAWLAGRTDPGPIDPAAVKALDLARALPADLADLPGWARFKGKPWTVSGHRLVVRAWEADPDNPERLRVASLHARNVLPTCAGDDKAAWPAGATAAALILATGHDPRAHGRHLVEIAEGVPDWLRMVLTRAELPKGKRPAVWGAWSGSPDPALAAVVPEGWTVALRTHADDAGDKYADKWRELLTAQSCTMHRERKANGPEALAMVWAGCCRQWGGADLVPAAVADRIPRETARVGGNMSNDTPFHDFDDGPPDWTSADGDMPFDPDDNADLLGDTMPMPDPAEVEAAKTVAALASKRLSAVLHGAVEQLRRRATGEDRPILLPNWPNFAATMGGGLWPGLHVLTGGTGTGKSQFALQLALQAAQGGVPTRYVGLELDDLGLVARLLCMAAGDGAGIWWSSLYTGKGGGVQIDAKLRQLDSAYSAELSSLPLYLDTDQGPHGWAYDQIGLAVEQLRAAHPEANGRPVLLVVDFLQLLGGEGNEDVRERIGKAAYQARQAARKHNAAILVLSSTARANYGTLGGLVLNGKGEPKTMPAELVGMGKESGDIEYAADSALVISRATGELDDNGNVYGGDSGAVWIAAAKLRAGSGKWCRLVERNGWFSEGEPQGPCNGKPKKTPGAAKVASGGNNGRDKAAANDNPFA